MCFALLSFPAATCHVSRGATSLYIHLRVCVTTITAAMVRFASTNLQLHHPTPTAAASTSAIAPAAPSHSGLFLFLFFFLSLPYGCLFLSTHSNSFDHFGAKRKKTPLPPPPKEKKKKEAPSFRFPSSPKKKECAILLVYKLPVSSFWESCRFFGKRITNLSPMSDLGGGEGGCERALWRALCRKVEPLAARWYPTLCFFFVTLFFMSVIHPG